MNTILVIKEIDYKHDVEYVLATYIVEDVEKFDLEKYHNEYLLDLYLKAGFEAIIDMGYIRIAEFKKGCVREMRKKLHEFEKSTRKIRTVQYYVENILKAKKVEFVETYND